MFPYLLRRLFWLILAAAACAGLLLLLVRVLAGIADPGRAGAGLLRGDFGASAQLQPAQPVGEMLATYLPDTLIVTSLGLLLGLLLALLLSGSAAARPASAAARFARLLASFGLITPLLWLLLVVLLQGSSRPLVAQEELGRLLLSAGLLGLLSLPGWTFVIYGALRGVMRRGYMRMARAKGVPARPLIMRHALRNAIHPRGAGWAFVALLMFGGVALVEALFGLSGAGRLLDDALETGDGPVILGVVAAFMAIFLLVILIVELLYALTNPRLKH